METNAGEDMGKWEPLASAGKGVNGTFIMEISVEVFKIAKSSLSYGHTIPGQKPKGLYIAVQQYILIHIYCCSINNC